MADKDPKNMTEKEKYWAGEPYDSAKLWAEMDDEFWDSTFDGLKDDQKPTGQKNPPSGPARPA